MIHHWKAFDLEIADFEYHHDVTYTGDTIPFQGMLYADIISLWEMESSIPRAKRVKKAKLDTAEQ